MLQHLNALPPDPILGLIAAHAADSNPKKIDLGIGVYKDEQGNTPILRCVKQAEHLLLEREQSKTYLGPPGVAGFNSAITNLVFGAGSDSVRSGRVQTIQTPGGTGALRVAGDLVQTASPGATIWMSDPTWANHIPVFSAAGLKMESYPYFDPASSSLRYDDMMAVLQERTPGEIVLFHGCCHNPCGVSPEPEQWEAISDVAAERGFTPMIDLAYQGFERGIEEDALAVRLFAEKCPEVIVASSCSKNFAVYRERTGAISVVCKTGDKAKDVVTVINSLTRQNYSMPPTHGPAAIDIILHSDELTALWREEVTGMRNRINGLRSLLVEKIKDAGIERDFSFLERQSGMFSFMGLNVEQVQRLRDEFSIYTVNSARVNIASFNDLNIDYFVEALKVVLKE
ncbi:MAG: amino acid aminotransferase [Lysobacterales bacterium]|jgi:aspartate aminotransferase